VKYRNLVQGDKIVAGDQYRGGGIGRWIVVPRRDSCISVDAGDYSFYKFRRPIRSVAVRSASANTGMDAIALIRDMLGIMRREGCLHVQKGSPCHDKMKAFAQQRHA